LDKYQLERYPKSSQNSLKAWNASVELLLNTYNEEYSNNQSLLIVHDRMGGLTVGTHRANPKVVVEYASQQKAIDQNLTLNNLDQIEYLDILDEFPSCNVVLMQVPKSIDLWEFYLSNIANSMDKGGVALAGFMTKYFSPRLLEVAEKYFEVVEQSRAVKKARLIILKQPKEEFPYLIHHIDYKEKELKQYYGVFSSKHIDYATQFFLEDLDLEESDEYVLDLASGNGIIAQEIEERVVAKEVHLIDDSSLAVHSSRLNCTEKRFRFHRSDTLTHFDSDYFDLIVSNPPFHFEYENNIDVSLSLFKEVNRILKTTGRFQLVANKHLNYKTHLSSIFSVVEIVKESDKFVVYNCLK